MRATCSGRDAGISQKPKINSPVITVALKYEIVQPDVAVSARPSSRRVLDDAVSAFALGYVAEDGLTALTTNFAETFVVDVSLASATAGMLRGGQNFVEPLATQAKLRNKVAA